MSGAAARARAAAAAPTDAATVSVADGLKKIGARGHLKNLALASCGQAYKAANDARVLVEKLGLAADNFAAGKGKTLAWPQALKLTAFRLALFASCQSRTIMDCIGSEYGKTVAPLGSILYLLEVNLSCDANTDIIADALVTSPFGQKLYELTTTTTTEELATMTPASPKIVNLRTLLQQCLPKLESFSLGRTTKGAQRQHTIIDEPRTPAGGKRVAASFASLVADAAAARSSGVHHDGAADATLVGISSSGSSSSGGSRSWGSSMRSSASSHGAGSSAERRRAKSSAASGPSRDAGSPAGAVKQAATAGSSGAGRSAAPITGVKRSRGSASLAAYDESDEDEEAASVRTTKRRPDSTSGDVINLVDSDSE